MHTKIDNEVRLVWTTSGATSIVGRPLHSSQKNENEYMEKCIIISQPLEVT